MRGIAMESGELGKFLVNFEESETFPRGEVSCIIKLDRDERSWI